MITTINDFKNTLTESNDYDNLSTDVVGLNKETLEPIDLKEFEIDSVVDIITDFEQIKKFESAVQSNSMTYMDPKDNKIFWMTVTLKPRNKSAAYPLGELGVIKCKILQTFYGLTKLKQLSNKLTKL